MSQEAYQPQVTLITVTAKGTNTKTVVSASAWKLLKQETKIKRVAVAQWGGWARAHFLQQQLVIKPTNKGLKPWSIVKDKKKILFRITPSILYPLLNKGQNASHLVLKPFFGTCNRANSRYSHYFCVLGVYTNFIKQINQAGMQYSLFILGQPRTKLYTAISRKVLLQKVHATIPRGNVGDFEFTVLQRNLKEWHERPWTFVWSAKGKQQK